MLLRVWAGTRDVSLLRVVPHTAAGGTELFALGSGLLCFYIPPKSYNILFGAIFLPVAILLAAHATYVWIDAGTRRGGGAERLLRDALFGLDALRADRHRDERVGRAAVGRGARSRPATRARAARRGQRDGPAMAALAKRPWLPARAPCRARDCRRRMASADAE